MPLTTELPIGDLFEFIGDFRLNGDGPPTTGRMGLDRLQAILLSSTSLVGAHIADIENRLTTAEGFTNQIASILTRLQTVEALGGISPGTDLAADGLAVRTTRYWGRPGEAIRAWTASIAAPPAAAVPLTEGGAYSIVPTALGPALRIAGAAAARPIAQVPLIEDQIEEFRVTVKRSADDATPANNAPVFVFGCFNADGTDNGTAPLPAEPLTVDQGFKTLIFRASRAAGFGTVDLPAGTRRVNLIPGGKGSGSIDVVSVERGPQSLTSAPLITTLGDTDFVATVSADRKSTSLITFAAFKDLMMEKFIPHVADATVGTAPVVLIPADPSRNNVQIINTSATSALLIGFGSPPVEGAKHTMLLPPSGGYEQRYCRTDAIYAMAKTGSVSVFANYTNRSGMDVVGDMIAAVYLARGSGNANTAERAAVTKLINRFRESGAYYKFRAAAIPCQHRHGHGRTGSRSGYCLVALQRPDLHEVQGLQGQRRRSVHQHELRPQPGCRILRRDVPLLWSLRGRHVAGGDGNADDHGLRHDRHLREPVEQPGHDAIGDSIKRFDRSRRSGRLVPPSVAAGRHPTGRSTNRPLKT